MNTTHRGEPFTDREHLRSWLFDPQARDQFVMFRGDNVGVFWNNKRDAPEPIVDRNHWTQLFRLLVATWNISRFHSSTGSAVMGGSSFKESDNSRIHSSA